MLWVKDVPLNVFLSGIFVFRFSLFFFLFHEKKRRKKGKETCVVYSLFPIYSLFCTCPLYLIRIVGVGKGRRKKNGDRET